MHILFSQAVRWELLDRNPITLVKQSGKRLKTPRALKPEEFKALVVHLAEPYKTMVITATGLGLRVFELIPLRGGDINFEDLTINVKRSIVAGEISPPKTTASEGTQPMDPGLAEILLQHKERSTFKADEDYVFAGPTCQWRWKDSILVDHIKPAATRAKIGKVVWNTFRHTYRALLKRCGTQLEVQKQLMRHSDMRVTIGYGIESDVAPANCEANSKVARMLLDH